MVYAGWRISASPGAFPSIFGRIGLLGSLVRNLGPVHPCLSDSFRNASGIGRAERTKDFPFPQIQECKECDGNDW